METVLRRDQCEILEGYDGNTLYMIDGDRATTGEKEAESTDKMHS